MRFIKSIMPFTIVFIIKLSKNS